MESIGTGPSSALDSTYGCLLIGLLFATFFQGLLTVQTFNYYENFPEDPLLIKMTVGLVWSFDTIHLVLIGQSAYHYLITNWGYQPILARSTWEICLQLAFMGLSTFVCQLFFLRRIWVFSQGNILIVGSILAVCLTTFALDILVTVQILQVPFVTEFGAKRAEIIALFTSGAAADVLIAIFLCYYLQRGRSTFEGTKSLVGKILQYTIATGLGTSALGIASIIAYFSQPHGFYFIAIHFCLVRLYTNALLLTLNKRRKLRMGLDAQTKSGSISTNAKETGLQFTRYVSPFESEGHITSVDRMLDRDDNGLESGKIHFTE